MRTQLPQRLSITGMVGLAALSATHWMRANISDPSILVFTALGLCSWEFMQTRSHRFVFDTNDIVATGFGSILAYLAFRWQVSSSRGSTPDSGDREGAP